MVSTSNGPGLLVTRLDFMPRTTTTSDPVSLLEFNLISGIQPAVTFSHHDH